MSKIINLRINVDDITKGRLFKGEKGTYLNVTVGENMDGESKYGDTHYVYESQTKDEREAKTPKNYLGNGKEFVFNDNGGTQTMATETVDDDLPF